MGSNRQGMEVDRGRRRGRRALVALVVLLALAVVIAAVAEWARRSALVDRLIVSGVQQMTGLATTASGVSVSWGGRTVVEGLEFRLPMGDEPVLAVGRVTVEHAPLLRLALTRDPAVRSVRLERLVVTAEQEAEADGRPGRWSVQRAIERVLASLPRGEGGPMPGVPRVETVDARVVIAPLGGERMERALALRVEPRGELAVALDARVEGVLEATGRAAVGGDWAHEVEFTLSPDDEAWEAATRIIKAAPGAAPRVAAHWSGGVRGGSLEGVLRIDEASAMGATVSGSMLVRTGASVVVEPRTLRAADEKGRALVVRGGRVRVDDLAIGVSGLTLESSGQTARVDGSLDLEAMAGRMEASLWGEAASIAHRGTLRVEVRAPAGRPTVAATLEVEAEHDGGRTEAVGRLTASGERWSEMSVALEFPRLRHEGAEWTWRGDGLAAHVALTPEEARLVGLDVPGALRSSVTGRVGLESLDWSLRAELEEWRVLEDARPATIAALARGRAGAIEAWEFEARADGVRVSGSGAFDPRRAGPLTARVDATLAREASVERGEGGAGSFLASAAGTVEAAFVLEGSLHPLQVEGAVELHGSGLSIRGRAMEDLTLTGVAEFGEEGGQFTFDEFAVLGGRAGATARTDWDGNAGIDIGVRDLSLAALSRLVGLEPGIGGTAGASVSATLPEGDLARLSATGSWSAANVSYRGVTAEEGSGEVRLEGDVLALEPMTLRRGDGQITGRACALLGDLSAVRASLTAREFQVDLGEVSVLVSGSAEGSVDPIGARGTVSFDGTAGVTFADGEIAQVVARGAVRERTVHLDAVTGRVGSGTIEGGAVIPLDALIDATASLTLRGFELSSLAHVMPGAEEFRGAVDGTFVLAPSGGGRAPAPSRLGVDFAFTDGAWRTLSIESLEVEAYVGSDRSVVEWAMARVGGGEVVAWGSTSLHNGERYVQAAGQARRVSLDEVVRAVAPGAKRYDGVVSAEFGGAGYVDEPHRLFGQAVVGVDGADLVNIPLVSQLYAAVNIGASGESKSGRGVAEARLEGSVLTIPQVQYFNRGLDLRASLNIEDVFAGGASPVRGMAVGVARSLAGSEIPLLGDADRMFAAAQEGGTVIRIEGTLNEPRVRVVPFAELRNFLSRVFGM